MPQYIVNALIGFLCAIILALSAWTMTEVTEQGKQSAAYAEAAVNLEQGYSIILRKIDEHQKEIQVNSTQIGRTVDRTLRNERDIERLNLSINRSANSE